MEGMGAACFCGKCRGEGGGGDRGGVCGGELGRGDECMRSGGICGSVWVVEDL